MSAAPGPAEPAATRLEGLIPGARIRGVVPGRSVVAVQTAWHGDAAVTLTYRDDEGRVGEQLLFRDDEARLTLETRSSAWAFDADGALFRLASEALRIRLAYLFDPYLAVHTSHLEPLPHQIRAVYEEMLPRQPLRFLLADDPGAGKTIMAGLFLKELMLRGDVRRCLVVAPGSLVEQWQDELWQKLGIEFDLVTRETIESSKSGNPYAEKDLVISRLDHLARNEEVQARLEQTEWDLIIVDEAHKMSAHYFGAEVKETKRYRLGKLLGSLTRHLLLMTATPHSGKDDDFRLFMSLLDPDRFEGRPRGDEPPPDAEGLMRRLVKEQLLKFDGRPLFPERVATTLHYELSAEEQRLYEAVTDYVREEMDRAERLRAAGEGRRGSIVGFALTILQRRLASSPEAIYQSLVRRRNRVEERVALARHPPDGRPPPPELDVPDLDEEDVEDFDDRPEHEIEALEEELVDQASAARTAQELRAELDTLRDLEELARSVRSSRSDRKWEELSQILQGDPIMRDAQGARRKLIIFTEHRDTLNYLAERIRTLLGDPEAVVTIHGGLRRQDRGRAQEAFVGDPEVTVLVATDAAGEGVNLQRAHLLVNYDLPWNPNRIEQRFGRIHRIGQTEVCHMWSLVAGGTREGQVFERLFEKLKEQRKALGGQVFDVLGQAFSERSLRDVLIDAVRYGDRPEVKARLDEVVDAAVGQRLLEALSDRALVADVMSAADVDAIRERMEQAEARRLQPHFVQSFFLEALRLLGGNVSQREPGRFEVTHVPAELRTWDRGRGTGSLLRRYERVTFERTLTTPPGLPPAQLLSPGHPLLDATVDLVLERHRALLRQGATLVAAADGGDQPRALLYIEDAIQSAALDRDGKPRVVSKRLQFIELERGGEATVAGYAPYLDYRPLEAGEAELLRPLLEEEWLREGVEAAGLDYAIRAAVPEHLAEVRGQTVQRATKTTTAVRERLTREIVYWDRRANELKAQELAGRKPRLNSGRARQRADDLQARLDRRLAELERERQLSPLPPVLVGGALVVPAGLLARLRGEDEAEGPQARETERVERIAVDAVLAVERRLGRRPMEMAHNNPGYDVLSKDPVTGEILFIEVKGRVRGAKEVTVTKTEILTSLNKPEQFVLALVAVDEDDEGEVRYLREPFAGPQETFFEVTSVDYRWEHLWSRARAPHLDGPQAARWVHEMVERIVREHEPLRIVVFGSHARREGSDASDVDLLVVLPEVVDRREQAVGIRRLLTDIPLAKDIIVTSPEDIERSQTMLESVIKTASSEGRVVYERA
ncbi:MAG: helicase-related protein [Thermoleophilaceae bacterium]